MSDTREPAALSFRMPRVAPEKADFRPALALRSLPGLNGTTMEKMTYREQLLHPMWQKRRLERLAAGAWTCETCMGTETTLHVHHRRYFKGRMAWEYADAELAVLCVDCHTDEHAAAERLNTILALLPAGYALDILIAHGDPTPTPEQIRKQFNPQQRASCIAFLAALMSEQASLALWEHTLVKYGEDRA